MPTIKTTQKIKSIVLRFDDIGSETVTIVGHELDPDGNDLRTIRHDLTPEDLRKKKLLPKCYDMHNQAMAELHESGKFTREENYSPLPTSHREVKAFLSDT